MAKECTLQSNQLKFTARFMVRGRGYVTSSQARAGLATDRAQGFPLEINFNKAVNHLIIV